jgi:hypothetical protein
MKLTKEQRAILQRLGWKKSKQEGVQMELDLPTLWSFVYDSEGFKDALDLTREIMDSMAKGIHSAQDALSGHKIMGGK